jgi:hypothetical protein
MRPAVHALVGLAAVGLVASCVLGGEPFEDSRHHAAIPDPGRCDLVVNVGNAATALALLNDPSHRVFCIQPGDYRALGPLTLSLSGSEASRRYLRFDPASGPLQAIQQSARALFEAIRVRGSWWVIQGLTIQPRDPATYWLLSIEGGDHDVADGNLIDGIEHLNPQSAQAGVVIGALFGDPATHNAVQDNVVRNGNQSRQPVDYTGIAVLIGYQAGADNDDNAVLDNEVYDWGDGIAIASDRDDCNFAARPHGTIVDGNDVYITGDKRIDCTSGAPDPNGDCACAENGIDIKPDPGPDPAQWTLVTNNRVWGFRPTRFPSLCGGSGALGQAISSGNQCPGHVLVAGNVVLDSTIGVEATGPGWIIAGNLLYEIRTAVGSAGGSAALLPLSTASDLDVEFNTIVGADNAYDDMSSNTVARCNVVIDGLGLNGRGGDRGPFHVTAYNFLYRSSEPNFVGATNQRFATEAESQNAERCFWRKRWTSPELVCVPFGATTAASPHAAAAAANCDRNLGAPFGLLPIDYF